MAAAISLYVNDGESIESISALLADTPIEQELWRELAQVFAGEQESSISALRQSKPRVTWIWSLDDEEMHLRAQNIILPAETELEGEPDRLVWLAEGEDDPLLAEIEEEVSPWRMNTGERIVNDVILAEPDGPLTGRLVLLTDMDETAVRLTIPPFPTEDVQFFRLTQQGAYGVPVNSAQVNDGVWLVCGTRPLSFFDEENERIKPDGDLPVPYPLAERYQWAVQITLNLPVSVKQGNKKLMTLAESGSQPVIGRPVLSGKQLIPSLSGQVQPTFASTNISLIFEYGGEQLLNQASLWLRGQNGWRKQWPLAELREQAATRLSGDRLDIDLDALLPEAPNFYSLELRFSLRPVFSAPLQFAVVPGLAVEPPDKDQLYTPVNPPQLILQGVDEVVIVRREGMTLTSLPDGAQRVTWTDLRHEPRLLLRFDEVDVPLSWNVPRFTAWLDPKPTRPFLTIAELQSTTLHVAGTKTAVTKFRLFVPGERYRVFSLRNGRYTAQIGQSQLYDMLRLAERQHTVLKVQVGADTWTLLELRQRPKLIHANVEYDAQEQVLLFSTGLEEAWVGNGRFVVESVTNPFAPTMELGEVTRLQDLHLLPAKLPDGTYLLRLELDGAWLPLPDADVQFSVGQSSDEWEPSPQLIQEIRNGRLISRPLSQDFVLWWAIIAERTEVELTSQTLFQLATIPASALENFNIPHLQKLWLPLVALKKVHQVQQWQTKYGLLPAWLLFASPIILKTAGHGYSLKVYPVQALHGGLMGIGYGRWRLSTDENASKELIYVQWQPISNNKVHVEAGIPEEVPNRDWTAVDLLDCYSLHYCMRCGWLTGAKTSVLPDDLIQEHLHGQPTADLRDITIPTEYDDYQLEAELLPERRGRSLLDIYDEFGVVIPQAEGYLPEPPMPDHDPLDQLGDRGQWLGLIPEIKRRGTNNTRYPFWSGAARLLTIWQRQSSVSQFGQVAFALGLLLRCAAIQQAQFHKLLKDANLSEVDCRDTLTLLNTIAPEHVQWGLTWAELLILHSPQGN